MFEVSDLKKKAQEIMGADEIDTHYGDLYLKVTDKSRDLLKNMKNSNCGLISTFKDQQTGELWYDIPFANWEDDYKSKRMQGAKEQDERIKKSYAKAKKMGMSNEDSVRTALQSEKNYLASRLEKNLTKEAEDNNKRMILVSNIDWETDGQKVDLPKDVGINFDDLNIDNIEDEYEVQDEINNYLSDFYGYLINNYDYEIKDNYLHIQEAEEETEEKEPEVKVSDPIMVYMNTWKNYNEYGADLTMYGDIDGWMTPEQALEFCKKYGEDEPFINDVDNNSDIDLEISEYDNAPSVLEGLVKLNDAMTNGAGNADKDEIGLVWEAWADRESVSTPSLENINAFLDFLENGEYYVHPDVTSNYDIGEWYIDNVGFEGVQHIEDYIDTDELKQEWQDEIDEMYLDDDGNPTEDWYEVDDFMVQEDIDMAVQGNAKDFFNRWFDYESLGDDIYGDGYWYVTDNGSVEIY